MDWPMTRTQLGAGRRPLVQLERVAARLVPRARRVHTAVCGATRNAEPPNSAAHHPRPLGLAHPRYPAPAELPARCDGPMNTRLLTLGLAVVLAAAIFVALRGASSASDPSVHAEPDPARAATPATTRIVGTVKESRTPQREAVPTGTPLAPTVEELELAAQLTHVTGRVVYVTGAPVASQSAGGRLTEADGSESELAFALDGDGRFRLDLARGDHPRTIAIRIDDQRPPRGAKAAVPVLAAGATFDVGDMVLVELPLLLRGHVVDDLSRPVCDAHVMLMATREVPSADLDMPHEVIRMS